MRQFWRRLTWQGRLVFLLLFWTLGMTALANISLFQMVGQMGLGVWVFWEPGLQCMRVSPVVSPHWPPVAEDRLHPSDCLTSIEGKIFYYQPDLQRYLTDEIVGRQGKKQVHVQGVGKQGIIDETLTLYRWKVHTILQAHLLNFIPGVALWLIGILVFLARWNEPLNQTIASFLFLGGMMLMGLNHWVGNYTTSVAFDILINALPRPLMGLLLIKLAMLFPKPVKKHLWYIFLWGVLLAMILLSIWGHALANLTYIRSPSHARVLTEFTKTFENGLFLVGALIFALRVFYWNRRRSSPKLRLQTFFLILALLSSFPIIIIDLLNNLSGLLLPMMGLYNLLAMGWIIPGAALLAYAMLRYQTFAYRGQFLSILLIFFISAAIVQGYAMIITLGQIDGVQWAMLWGVVLLTTTLFYADTSLRRFFIRYFSRHSYDYEVVVQFVQQVGRMPSEKRLLEEASRALCRWLRVDWVAIWSPVVADLLWFATNEGETIETQPVDNPPSQPPFDDTVHQERLLEGLQSLGVVWFGPRVTAEPFDEKDQRLAHLLATELARTLALRSYIAQLEATPGRILAAVDRERHRIGRDLHDGVLQFLGALPFILERMRSLQSKDPAGANALAENIIRQVEVLSKETRGLAYDLSLPGVREGNLLEMAYNHAQFKCRLADVQLNWQVLKPHAWEKVYQAAAVHVYRILQESLHNAIRHGKPAQVTIVWDARDDELVLDIIDDGVGFQIEETSPQGLGMTSMRERARALGGRLEVASRPGQGAHIRLAFRQEADA